MPRPSITERINTENVFNRLTQAVRTMPGQNSHVDAHVRTDARRILDQLAAVGLTVVCTEDVAEVGGEQVSGESRGDSDHRSRIEREIDELSPERREAVRGRLIELLNRQNSILTGNGVVTPSPPDGPIKLRERRWSTVRYRPSGMSRVMDWVVTAPTLFVTDAEVAAVVGFDMDPGQLRDLRIVSGDHPAPGEAVLRGSAIVDVVSGVQR